MFDSRSAAAEHRQRDAAAPAVFDYGQVTAVGNNQATVNTWGSTETLPVAQCSGLPLLVGDVVIVLRGPTASVILARMPRPDTAPPPVDPPVDPGGPSTGTDTFTAVDARSWRRGAWRTDTGNIAQGDWGGYGDNTGCWFYGDGPTDRLRGATITGAAVRLRRRSGGVWAGQTAHVYRHTARTRPDAVPGEEQPAADGTAEIGAETWIALPADWGQQIVDAGGGLLIKGAPYVVCDGLDADPQSGLLRLDWQRT